MQMLTLGSGAAREPLEDVLRRVGPEQVEIVDPTGEVIAYLLPAPRPGDDVYKAFEEVFAADLDTIRRRQQSSDTGATTTESSPVGNPWISGHA